MRNPFYAQFQIYSFNPCRWVLRNTPGSFHNLTADHVIKITFFEFKMSAWRYNEAPFRCLWWILQRNCFNGYEFKSEPLAEIERCIAIFLSLT